jgi:ABC-type ATPase involved in cell division
MSVVALEDVGKRFRRGHRELVALRNVSTEIENGEVVVISGARSSGRTTLLRLVAGTERPDEGRVLFSGVDLAAAAPTLRRQIAFCNTRFLPQHGRDALDHVAMPLAAIGVAREESGLRAHRALERVGADDLAFTAPETWIPSEALRVSLARAIVREPRVLLIDEPVSGVDPTERDPLLSIIQRVAHESGIATLVTAGETTSVTGADRVMMLSDGELLGRSSRRAAAPVVELRRPSAES